MPGHPTASLETFAFFSLNSHPEHFERPPSTDLDIEAWQKNKLSARSTHRWGLVHSAEVGPWSLESQGEAC